MNDARRLKGFLSLNYQNSGWLRYRLCCFAFFFLRFEKGAKPIVLQGFHAILSVDSDQYSNGDESVR